MNRNLILVALIFAFVGALMLIGDGFYFVNTRNFLEKSIVTTGVVQDILRESEERYEDGRRVQHTYYYPEIVFKTKDGKEVKFRSGSSSSTPDYYVGQSLSVRYDPDNPIDAKIDSFFSIWLGVIVFGIFGSIFFVAGAGIVYYEFAQRKKEERLKQHGRLIETDFLTVKENISISYGKSFQRGGYQERPQHPYQILSQWKNPEDHKIYVFKSKNIWYNPESLLKDRKIKVYVDPKNFKKYFMDTSFLNNI